MTRLMVERESYLKEVAAYEFGNHAVQAIYRELLAEIAALRAELEKKHTHERCYALHDSIIERDRYREALEIISKMRGTTKNGPWTIAHDALKPQKKQRSNQ